MAQWVEGRVAAKRAWTERLYSLQVEAEIQPFEAGQFTKLGLELDGEIVARPYSFVNSPTERPLDFCFSIVPGGPLSPRLAALEPGERVLVAPRAAGFLVLSGLPQAPHLWLISTGTGIGPFLSILKTATPWQRFERIVLVHAVRLQRERLYVDTIEAIAAAHPAQFTFVPFVSREQALLALPGRIPQAISEGSLEARAGIHFGPETSQIMLCGNPQMVEDVTRVLLARGLKKHRRRDPGQISVESYW